MDLTGEYTIPAKREAVWAALNDPDVLKVCMPGCDEMEKHPTLSFQPRSRRKLVRCELSSKVR